MAAALRKRIGLCPHVRVHLSSQALDKHCVIHLANLGTREPREPHSAHSSPLTAPGTAAVSPGCPKIPADSSVGERGQREGTGGISWGLPPTRPPQFRRESGAGVGRGDGPDSSFFFGLRDAQVSLEAPGNSETGAARRRGRELGPGPRLPQHLSSGSIVIILEDLMKPLWVSASWSGNAVGEGRQYWFHLHQAVVKMKQECG